MWRFIMVGLCLLGLMPTAAPAQPRFRSHPPLRTAPPPANRPLAKGPAFYVDPRQGDDDHEGGQADPWRTIGHALTVLRPGATLYLRGGTYYENVAVRLVGQADAPVTLRSFPGEQAVLDGSLPFFVQEPDVSWNLVDARTGEYRSTRIFPNLRDMVGRFGDSLIGLHTYHHAKDLRATNELAEYEDEANPQQSDLKPVYCGPGLWYDAVTGHVHVRLAHTHLPDLVNYRGETDPHKLPLLIAPLRSVPLTVDGARHVRFQDLVIRGGGYDCVVLQQCADVEFDNVTIWGGTYGLRATGVHRLKLWRCGFYGSVPPWTFRTDTSLRSYPGLPHRDLTRLGTHALLVPEGGREFEVYSLPINDDWEIAYCDFTDGHDGIYLGGINLDFHHNRVFDMQDDGVYFSPMYSRVGRGKATLRVHENYFGRSLTALAFGGPEKLNEDVIFFYRNLVDLRGDLLTGRPSPKDPEGRRTGGKVIGDHGSPPWSAMNIYHNTVIAVEPARGADMVLLGAAAPERPRRLFNNVVVHLTRLPALVVPDSEAIRTDGNLFWSPGVDARQAAAFFTKYRASPAFARSKAVYPPGYTTHSLVADPKFLKAEADPGAVNDYRLQAGSPAIDAGIELPADWPDPLRKQDKGQPDVGALPRDSGPLQAGRDAAP